MRKSNYDKFPVIAVSDHADQCWRGWGSSVAEINTAIARILSQASRCVVAIEFYTGLHEDEVAGNLQHGLHAAHFLPTSPIFKSAREIDSLAAPYLGGDDPIFGYLCPLSLEMFLDSDKRDSLRRQVAGLDGAIVVCGIGASLCVEPDILIYADMPRWEGQLRQRRDEVDNLGVVNKNLKASLQYKRAFFVDWRVCDRLKRQTLPRWDYLLDTTVPNDPKLITGGSLRAALRQTARQPFRVVPFFDPAPWGGQWMKEVCDLDRSIGNYGWCFDCVPEENSLLLQFGDTRVEIPALDLVFYQPDELLGEAVTSRFGAEFPIRFDFLDTIHGGNLSLQVHPPASYAREQFGLTYTQDESYYILDAGGSASVYLGLKADINPNALFATLEKAQTARDPFPVDQFVNQWPAAKHDHFLIPAGTIHCSGAEAMVLEISATPYIFTFKLWDWGRLGLDGVPRPINLERGRASLHAERDTEWVRNNLINHFEPLASGDSWREERTGLHPLEFIETRRHWFTGKVPHETRGTVNVLNLVQGAEAIVESPTAAFAPYIVHYAETFIVPAAVGPYTITPHGDAVGTKCATLKAFVRAAARHEINRSGTARTE